MSKTTVQNLVFKVPPTPRHQADPINVMLHLPGWMSLSSFLGHFFLLHVQLTAIVYNSWIKLHIQTM